ncbi:MAG: T9SS type A sorting domain-containing protein [Saprospiraceae bacterium]|nr:T9SS type A sorting domain-containing protein [Saprospiraceae bacterium]
MLLNAFGLQAQSTVIWSDSIVVVPTSLPVTAPRISFLQNGTPVVTWGTSASSTSQIWCSRFENGGFTAPAPVVQSPNSPILFGFGGYDMAIYGNKIFVVFEQLAGGIWCVSSSDGGQSFGTAVLVQAPISGGYATISSITTDDNGNPIISYIREKNGAVYEVRKSTDGGLSFGDPVIANAPAPGGAVCECCSADMLTSGDSVWIVFRNNDQNIRDIWISRSTDLAASFDIAADIDETDWQVNTCPISGPRMARMADSIAGVWMSQASGTARVYANTLHAGKMTVGPQMEFLTDGGVTVPQTFPDIAAEDDTVGIVFLEKSREIVFFHTTTGMGNFQQPGIRIAKPNHTLQWPTLGFHEGAFHLVYVDATADLVLYRRGTLLSTNSTVEPTQEGQIQIFPNPAPDGSFQILCREGMVEELMLWNLLGQCVHHWRGLENNPILTLTGTLPGIYTIRVKHSGGVFIGKVQIK